MAIDGEVKNHGWSLSVALCVGADGRVVPWVHLLTQ